MAIKILMPALSPTMEVGKISKWLKKEGDKVKSGDIIAEIETDKATMEFEVVEDGVIGKIVAEAGDEDIAVNRVIAVLLEEGEGIEVIEGMNLGVSTGQTAEIQAQTETSKIQTQSSGQAQLQAQTQAIQAIQTTIQSQNFPNMTALNMSLSPYPNSSTSSRKNISPLAKKIATLNALNIANIQGSGPNGRIIKHDIERVLQQGTKQADTLVNTNTQTTLEVLPFLDEANSSMRKIIAKRLLESKQNIPHYYLTVDCNMDSILQARAKLNELGKDTYKLSVNDFVIKAVGFAMRDIPAANASWLGETTRFYQRSDVSVAVATKTGLITPIVKDTVNKGLVQISNDMKDLAGRAREGKLKPIEYQGGGFAVSNLGMFGIKEFIAIINPPQAGILAVGVTEERAIVEKGQIRVANMMSVTLSADHRILDGVVGTQFLQAFKKYIENPLSMIL